MGLDHRDWLGDTLEQIGAEKAGIFRPARPAVLGTPLMPASVYEAIARLGCTRGGRRRASSTGRSAIARWDYQGLALSLRSLPPSALAGSIQYRNAATALAALEALRSRAAARPAAGGLEGRLALDERTCAALRRVRLPGRFQVITGEVEWILDIAHNEPAAGCSPRSCASATPRAAARPDAPSPCIGVLARQGRRGHRRRARRGHRPLDRVRAAGAARHERGGARRRALSPPAASVELAGSVVAGCELALEAAQPGDRVVVCGSVYAVGPALQWLRIY